jgi:hypothetical protein
LAWANSPIINWRYLFIDVSAKKMELFANMHALMQKQNFIYITKSLHMKSDLSEKFGTFLQISCISMQQTSCIYIKYGTCNSKNIIVGFCKGGDDHC